MNVMRPPIRLPSSFSFAVWATLAGIALVPACSDSGPSDGTGAGGAGATAGSAGRGGNGGVGGREGGAGDADGGPGGSSGAGGASSGGASGMGGSKGDASTDVRADAEAGAGDVSVDTGGAGGANGDASDGTGGAGGATGTGGTGGAMDGGNGDVRDASAETDAKSTDASSEDQGPIVDVSSGDVKDGTTGGDGGADGTTVVAAGVRWMGRVDTTNPAAPRFAWSGTGFAAQFSGTSVGVDLQNEDAYFFQAVIDGQKGARFQVAKGRATQVVATGLAAGSHTLELYREIETYYGTSQFFGITQATLQPPPPSRGRLLEFVGDSISAGYGNLGSEPHVQEPQTNVQSPILCPFSFATESAYMSYGAVAARALSADASIIAESGWGVYRDRTGGTDEVLPKVYDRIFGNDATPVWDFRTKPQAVVINLGTNDFAPGDPGNAFATALGAFVDTVRGRYPAAWIFCAVGTMLTNAEHAQALSYTQSVITARGGDAGKVAVVNLGVQDTTNTGCDWHPSAAEHQRMADVLVPVLKQKLGW